MQTMSRTYIDYDYFPGFNMNFSVGNHITKNDVIASAKPKDLGRIRIMMDLGDIMSSSAKRYIPMTLEEANVDSTTTTNYFIFSAYISTDDMVDSKHIMSIENGYVMTDGSSGKNHSLSIPIDNLPMKLHAFYEYREEDELNEATRNPRHDYSSYNYVAGYTFTNTYELFDGDYITLMKSLDNARGFLDALERPQDPTPEPELSQILSPILIIPVGKLEIGLKINPKSSFEIIIISNSELMWMTTAMMATI